MAIKSKNRAKIFLGGGQMTKIKTKLYIFFLLQFFFSLFWGTMAHPGPPSLRHWQYQYIYIFFDMFTQDRGGKI
jgi:hypothetical protein